MSAQYLHFSSATFVLSYRFLTSSPEVVAVSIIFLSFGFFIYNFLVAATCFYLFVQAIGYTALYYYLYYLFFILRADILLVFVSLPYFAVLLLFHYLVTCYS